MTVMLLKQYWY